MMNALNARRRLLAAGLALPLLATTATLALAQGQTAPTPPAAAPAAPAAVEQAPARGPAATPVTVSELRDMSAIELKGRVAETFGNSFILEDATGRTLVDTGPRGNRGDLVANGDEVTVQGEFERGKIDARALTVAGGETIRLERPRPERGGDRGPRHGPGHGPRGPEGRDGPDSDRTEHRGGGWFSRGGVDAAAAEASLTAAGYTQVALLEEKRHHAEFTAQDASGATWLVKVDEDNAVREREPYQAPMSEEAARAAVEALGYTWDGDFETEKDHVEVDATDASGRSVRVELLADGTLKKERFED